MNRYDDEEYPDNQPYTPPRQPDIPRRDEEYPEPPAGEPRQPAITRRLLGHRRLPTDPLPQHPPDQTTQRIDEPQRSVTAHPDGVGYAKSLVCSECNGDMVWAHTSLYLRPGVSLGVEPWFHQGFMRTRGSELNALVCGNCGFTRLYAAEPAG